MASIPCMGVWLAEQDWYRVLKKHRRIGGLRLRLYLLVFSNLISYMYMCLFLDTQKFKEYLLLRWKDGFPSTSRCSPAKYACSHFHSDHFSSGCIRSRVPRKPKEKPKANSDSSVIVVGCKYEPLLLFLHIA